MFLQEYAVYWVIGILLWPAGRRLAEKEAGFPAEAVENKLCRGLSCGNGGDCFSSASPIWCAAATIRLFISTFKEEAW